MANTNILTEAMIAREIVRIVGCLTYFHFSNFHIEKPNRSNWESYCGIICFYDYDPRTDEVTYKIECGPKIKFDISIDGIYRNMSLDDFAEFKLISKISNKLDQHGYATWD